MDKLKIRRQETAEATKAAEGEEDLESELTHRDKILTLGGYLSVDDDFDMAPGLIPQACIDVFTHLSSAMDSNPRRIKRVLNVFQVRL